MPPEPTTPPVRLNVYLSASDRQLLAQLAADTEEGNVSRLIRRLVREEAKRMQRKEGKAA